MNAEKIEDFYNDMKKKKTLFFKYMIFKITKSHSLFLDSHLSEIKKIEIKKKSIQYNSYLGTVITIFLTENIAFKKNLMYRLTYIPKIRNQLMKYFILPSIVSSYLRLRYEKKTNPIIEEIFSNYDVEDEKFKQVFIDYHVENKFIIL